MFITIRLYRLVTIESINRLSIGYQSVSRIGYQLDTNRHARLVSILGGIRLSIGMPVDDYWINRACRLVPDWYPICHSSTCVKVLGRWQPVWYGITLTHLVWSHFEPQPGHYSHVHLLVLKFWMSQTGSRAGSSFQKGSWIRLYHTISFLSSLSVHLIIQFSNISVTVHL
jgi:hypothetical protein